MSQDKNKDDIINKIYEQEIDENEAVELLWEELGEKESEENKTPAEDDYIGLVQEDIKTLIAEISGINITKIKIDQGFFDLGLESSHLMTLVKKLEVKMQVELYPTLLFEYKTIQDLTEYLLKEFGNKYPVTENKTEIKQKEPKKTIVNKPTVIIEKKNTKIKNFPTDRNMDIAIIGLAGKYPMADDVNELWENLKNGKDCITEVPKDRWNWEEFYDPDPDKAKDGKIYCKEGGFLSDVDKFDPLFFNISPREAELMDPQERWFLQIVWKAIEDAGYTLASLGKNVGVFAGVTTYSYNLLGPLAWQTGNYDIPRSFPWTVANRISYCLNFTGPSIPVDTACSSSLTAVHFACESLKNNECGIAITGGVNFYLHYWKFLFLCQNKMLSPDGRSFAFSDKANGFGPGEGVGAIILKPLSKAIDDNDHIYGVIKATAVNHGGKSSGFYVPDPVRQADVIYKALEQGNINPESISYIEAHGTGTDLGDPIEIQGLTKAYSKITSKKQFCSVGSLKSNIGHLEAGAGIAGVTKILLQMKYKQLVPSIYADMLNPKINFVKTPFYVQKQLEEWKQPKVVENGEKRVYPRRAGISGFGAGGANAHVVIEEYFEKPEVKHVEQKKQVIVLSAKSEEQLRIYVKSWMKSIEKTVLTDDDMESIAYTSQTGREAMEYRLAIIAAKINDLKDKIGNFLENKKTDGLFWSKVQKGHHKQLELHNINKIAELWVSGHDVDWNQLHASIPQKISLPTYPFASKRYWISQTESASHKRSVVKFIHPLIDYNDSTLLEQKYVKEFTGKEIYLVDHIVQGQKVLPGVVYLEYARAAGVASTGKKIVQLKNVVWRRPFVASDDLQKLNIRLMPEKNKILYDFYTPAENEKLNIIYSQGELLYSDKEDEKGNKINILGLEKELTGIIDAETCYRKFAKSGLTYGNSFQAIKQIRYNKEKVFAQLEISDELFSHYEDFTLIPSIMDGALQSTIGFDAEGKSSATYLPFSLGSIEIIRPMMKKCFSYVLKNSETSYDISILDEAGNVLVRINNFVVKELKQLAVSGKKEKKSGRIYIKDAWIEKNLTGEGEDVDSILIIDTDDEIITGLKNRFKDVHIISVKPGKEYREVGEHQYEIDVRKREDYKRLFESLKKNGIRVRKIVHNISKEKFADGNIETQMRNSIYSMFYVSQELFAQKSKENVQIVYLYNRESEPVYSGVSGFARTAGMENTKVRYKVIGLEKDAGIDYAEMVARELKEQDGSCEEIKYKGKSRYIKQYEEIGV